MVARPDSLHVKVLVKVEPGVIMYDVPWDYAGKAAIIQQLLDKNEVSKSVSRDDWMLDSECSGSLAAEKANLVVRCSQKVHRHLVKAGRVYVGRGFCRVVEHIDPLWCFKCWRFGHYLRTCRASRVTCSRCGTCS